MLYSVIVALIVYFLSNSWHIFGILNDYLNFAVWAVIVFTLLGFFAYGRSQPVAGVPARRWYLW